MNRIRSYTQHLDPAERRRSERFESNRGVKFTKLQRAQAVEIKQMTRIVDVSHSGLRLVSRECLVPKTVLRLDFMGTHDLRPFTIKGVVVWNRTAESQAGLYDSGVIFLHAPEHVGNIIQGRITENQI